MQQAKEIQHELKEFLICLNCAIASEKMKQRNLNGIQPDQEPDLSMALTNNASCTLLLHENIRGVQFLQFLWLVD